jgi:hypothetical protein
MLICTPSTHNGKSQKHVQIEIKPTPKVVGLHARHAGPGDA